MNKIKVETWDSGSNLIFTTTANGRNKEACDFNILQEYLELFKEKPSVLDFYNRSSDYYDHKKLMKYLNKEFNLDIIFEEITYNLKKNKKLEKKQIIKIADGYLLKIENIFNEDCFSDEYNKKNKIDKLDLIVETNEILIPNIDSERKNDEVENKLIEIFKKSKIDYKCDDISIGLVSVDGSDLYVEDFYLSDKISDIKYLDLHYGEGFEDWHKALLKRLKVETKGLVLLHGKTGTGKSYYVRQLLKDLSQTEKNILYFPPVLVSSITDPSFINFISSWAMETDKKGILLIEDAEPLLESRDAGRNMGITNLLNLTDGLLNDILGIQIIATFNVELRKIDDALLRQERLIARKEFTTLPLDQATKLVEKLKIDKCKLKKDMTLADIYAIKKQSEILEHSIQKETNTVGFKTNK
jgi:hypothetical protein